ncbi:MAG: DNA topoisomerase I [Nitrososphaeraceae archaeon]|nr:DNA topoisomerase I [Nitrososphaeraceae archaeon]
MKWQTLQHNGIAFPPEYKPRGISISIVGEEYSLNADQEELIYAWAKKKDTHYVRDNVFESNFLIDLRSVLPPRFGSVKKISELDLANAYRLVDEENRLKEVEKERIRNLPRDEKRLISQSKKNERERLRSIYGLATVDGVTVEIANWLVEPPGLFMGRGQHPLRGRWKPRVLPQDVILNLGENAEVPEGNWKAIVNDHTSTWLATWIENLTGKRKYMWLHDSSTLRQNSDKEKYDRANILGKHINKVHEKIVNKMINSKDLRQKKISTVCYLINKLAMRVGDEKDPDEADTVGASTLRVEHIRFPVHQGIKSIEFNFLGKDSVPWQKSLEISSRDTEALYINMELFMKDKKPNEQIFDGITSAKVNSFLRTVDKKNVPGLTAKVFRTYIATQIVKEALARPPISVNKRSSEMEKIYVAKSANLVAAVTCNHKKGIDVNNPASKQALERFQNSVEKKQEAIRKIENDIASHKWKTDLHKKKMMDRLEKIQITLRLQKETRDYNLGTSLRNYIDPRVLKSWMSHVELDWKRVFTSTLQRKFRWVETYSNVELQQFLPEVEELGYQESETVIQEESLAKK